MAKTLMLGGIGGRRRGIIENEMVAKDFGFPEAARRVMGITPPHRQSASFMVVQDILYPHRWTEDGHAKAE